MQKELEELNKLVSEIQKSEVKLVADSIKNKLGLLKTCYDKSDNHIREKVHKLIKYRQLRCYLTGEPYTNTSTTKKIKLNDIAYTDRSIKLHIKNGLPKETNWQPVDIYSFHFGGYKIFFRCFGRGFLKDKMKLDTFFIEDIYSESNVEIVEVHHQSKAQIAGATIINQEFINSVKSGKEFTMPEFYGAKQNNKCQWYGIINDFDVFRNGYEELKEVVIDSFLEEKDGKVTAIVHGTGGSGKSTVLRRLAIDFHSESFDVIWLEKGKVEEFVEEGLIVIKNEIEKNENRKFLIVIEDWYRMFDDKQKVQLGSKILEETFNMNNTRLVIADRDNNKQYRNYRNNNFELYLSSQDNKEIIKKIAEKYPSWKFVLEKLFEKEKFNQSSLFLLLFIIARVNQNQYNENSFDLYQPQQVFLNIIESDLNFIAKTDIGLAKALYYLGYAYSKYKVFFSYEVFIQIANYYETRRIINPIYSNWKIDTPVINKLKNYFSVLEGTSQGKEINVIYFNHDVLIDDGLSKLKIDDWDDFDEKVKLELLKIITENDNFFSASTYLNAIIEKEGHLFKNENQKIDFIEKQIQKGNFHNRYLYGIMGLSPKGLEYFATKLIDKNFDTLFFWQTYFLSCSCNDWIINKLDIKNIKNLNPIAVYKILSIYNEEATHNLHPEIIPLEREFSEGILEYKSSLQKFSEDILNHKYWEKLDYRIIAEAIELSNGIVRERFCNNIISNDNWFSIHGWVLITSLKLSENLSFKESLCEKVLTFSNWKNLSIDIVVESLTTTKNKDLITLFTNKILSETDIGKINPYLISNVIEKSSNKELALHFISNYRNYLDNKEYYYAKILIKSLSIFSNEKKIPKEVILLIDFIIDMYYDADYLPEERNEYYTTLMGLSFHNHIRWKKEAEFYLSNFDKLDKHLLINILLSYRKYPDRIKHICSNILFSWDNYQNSSDCSNLNILHFKNSFDYFQIALGHPELKVEAKKTALKILETIKKDKINIPHLKETALKIVESDVYPEWKF